jgi:hypothetical protein
LEGVLPDNHVIDLIRCLLGEAFCILFSHLYNSLSLFPD